MMATEATSDNIAPSSTIPDNELNTTETAIQDDLPEQSKPLVNGNTENDGSKPDTEPVDPVNVSAEVSVSGGSDTEASKAETSRTTVDEKGHVRSASTVKKFASFKPVSVNKTFLAAKGTTPATPSKLGDKAAAGAATAQTGPSTSTASRPRLVAKSGSGLRDSTPRASTAANGGKPGGAPDASAVWNKNRPAPPPEPKRVTDEELKQRYGIHLATRIQPDDPKQANWADIDDDDDDWAPESIEWTDGTKITLPQVDDTPAPREPSPIPVVKEVKVIEVAKPKSPAPPQASASPTIRPSGSGKAGLILKGATEKPTLVAKPPGPPTPVKSPWASLPPVDKVAPIAIDIPQNQQQQQNRFAQRDPHGFQGMPPPPAKEIAADDFSRSSWRENSHTSQSRTLFNSQSGGYEPVNDNRRGSRNEAHSRQPAVLQRPAHAQQDGPAEPSPAFQTHRASGQDIGYGRRRTSSNVSGGSGNFTRRMSRGHDMPPPHEMLAARRGSLAAVSDAPSSPRNFSPSGQYPNQNQNQNQRGYQNQQQWQSRASPVVSHQSPQSVSGQPIPPGSASLDQQAQSHITFEDPVEEQKKIMRQARELAIKRRQEEEAKEEAARKERLRVKLEAMGPAPEKKTDKKEASKDEKPIPTQIQTREADGVTPVSASGESKLKNSDRVEKVSPSTAPGDSQPSDRPSSFDHRPNGLPKGASTMNSNNQSPQDGRSWQNTPASAGEQYRPWVPPSAQQSSSRNVWGPPPSNERPLGNGTFNPDLSRLPESQPSGAHPGPIGPPNRGNGQGQYQQGRGRDYGPRPAPIGPPNRQPTASREQQQRVAASGWADLPEKLARDDAQYRQQQDAEMAQKLELKSAGILPEEVQPVYKDTWRKVTLNEDGTRSKIQGSSTSINDTSGQWKAQEESMTRPIFEDRRPYEASGDMGQPHFNDAWKGSGMAPSPAVRGSRFFPNSNRDTRIEEQNALFGRPGSPSPPPPTMADHPAYDGDIQHPHVSLPRPSPVVKLPPTVLPPIGPPKPASFAAAVTAPAPPPFNQSTPQYGRSSQDIRNEPAGEPRNWQDRISSLLGRKNSPPKSNILAVDSASKNALEIPQSQFAATVSLPSSVSGDLAEDSGAVITKPAAEECFEPQEMGSLPLVKVPVHAPKELWKPAPPPKNNPSKKLSATSSDEYKFEQTTTQEPEDKDRRPAYHIRFPDQETTVYVRINISARQRSNPKPRGSRNGAPRGGPSSHRGRGGRDTTSGFQSPGGESSASSPNTRGGHRGNRGNGSRGGGNGGGSREYNWTRHPAPVAN